MRSKKASRVTFFAAALIVLAAGTQSAVASLYFDDGGVHQISGDSIKGGVQVSNSSVVEVFGGAGVNCGSLDMSGGGILCFEGSAPQPDTVTAPVPEPNTIIIWSCLGGLGLALGCWRKRNAAFDR